MDLSDAYANAAHIPGGPEFPTRWATEARAFRAAHPPEDIPYGDHPRERLHLFRLGGTPRGLVVFVHGGYWKAFDRETFSHLAAGPLARGWAVALPSYPLCPEVGIGAKVSSTGAGCTPYQIVSATSGAMMIFSRVSRSRMPWRLGLSSFP